MLVLMYRAASSFIAIICLLAGAKPALAEDGDIVLEANGPWRLDYNETRCRLIRELGEEGNRHFIYFEQFAPARHFNVTAAGPAFADFRETVAVSIALGDETPREPMAHMGQFGSYGAAVFVDGIPAVAPDPDAKAEEQHERGFKQIEAEALAEANFIRFAQRQRAVRFETRSLKAPMMALNQCSENRLVAWGLDLERHRTMRSGPRFINRREIVTKIRGAFPYSALRTGQSGVVRMRVIVGEDGAVTDCHIHEMTEFVDVTDTVCEIMDQAQYTPALDAGGLAMPSFQEIKIEYRNN